MRSSATGNEPPSAVETVTIRAGLCASSPPAVHIRKKFFRPAGAIPCHSGETTTKPSHDNSSSLRGLRISCQRVSLPSHTPSSQRGNGLPPRSYNQVSSQWPCCNNAFSMQRAILPLSDGLRWLPQIEVASGPTS